MNEKQQKQKVKVTGFHLEPTEPTTEEPPVTVTDHPKTQEHFSQKENRALEQGLSLTRR